MLAIENILDDNGNIIGTSSFNPFGEFLFEGPGKPLREPIILGLSPLQIVPIAVFVGIIGYLLFKK